MRHYLFTVLEVTRQSTGREWKGCGSQCLTGTMVAPTETSTTARRRAYFCSTSYCFRKGLFVSYCLGGVCFDHWMVKIDLNLMYNESNKTKGNTSSQCRNLVFFSSDTRKNPTSDIHRKCFWWTHCPSISQNEFSSVLFRIKFSYSPKILAPTADDPDCLTVQHGFVNVKKLNKVFLMWPSSTSLLQLFLTLKKLEKKQPEG